MVFLFSGKSKFTQLPFFPTFSKVWWNINCMEACPNYYNGKQNIEKNLIFWSVSGIFYWAEMAFLCSKVGQIREHLHSLSLIL